MTILFTILLENLGLKSDMEGSFPIGEMQLQKQCFGTWLSHGERYPARAAYVRLSKESARLHHHAYIRRGM